MTAKSVVVGIEWSTIFKAKRLETPHNRLFDIISRCNTYGRYDRATNSSTHEFVSRIIIIMDCLTKSVDMIKYSLQRNC